jgi:N4-gp56 family major capsid protein
MATNVPYGSAQAITLQSAGLFAANMQRNTTINRLTGKFPQQSDAESNLRSQSSSKMPIVKCMDLQKMAGDEITFDLINPMGGKPIMGGNVAEGRGRAMTFSQDRLRINQARYPISAGDTMTQQRTPHQMRGLARAEGESYMNRLQDQLALVHMAGSRGFHSNIEWAVPLASDADFADIAVNTVKAPTKNRHFMSTGSGIEIIKASGNEITLATTDVMNADVVDGIRTYVDSMPLPPPPVVFEGDKMASDAPLRVLLVSSEQYTSFVQSTGFRTLQANAMQRASQAGNNPLFMGEAGLWNGILIVKMPKPIRFYSGDSLAWCASYTSETETTTDLVPASFSTTYAVDRAILLGGQALAEAWGKHKKSGSPFFWSEKELDHDDKLELLVGAVNGRSKIRFLINHGDASQYTDYGVMCIDTVVRISGQ